MTPPAEEQTPHRLGVVPLFVLAGLLLGSCVCVVPVLGPFLLQGAGHLAFGWCAYLSRVLPRVQVNLAGAATALGCMLGLGIGGHAFAAWLRRSLDPQATPWRARWTVAFLGLVILAFTAGVAAVGVTHQTAWLATSPERLTRASWPSLSELPVMHSLPEIARAQELYRERTQHYGTLPELTDAGLLGPTLTGASLQDYSLEVCPSLTDPGERWFVLASSRRQGCRQFFMNKAALLYQWPGEPRPVDRGSCEPPEGFVHVR